MGMRLVGFYDRKWILVFTTWFHAYNPSHRFFAMGGRPARHMVFWTYTTIIFLAVDATSSIRPRFGGRLILHSWFWPFDFLAGNPNDANDPPAAFCFIASCSASFISFPTTGPQQPPLALWSQVLPIVVTSGEICDNVDSPFLFSHAYSHVKKSLSGGVVW
jgi:hypothetical protein